VPATDAAPAARAADHLDGFLRSLGESGVRVPVPKRADFLQALALFPPAGIDGLYWTARVTLLTRIEDVEPFDAVFDAWFRKEPVARIEVSLPAPDETGEALVPGGAKREGELPPESLGEGSGLEASGTEVVARKTFPAADAEAPDVLRELHAALPRALPTSEARRLRRSRRGRQLDLPRVCREANRTAGEVIRLSWRDRPRRPRPVLLLVDVSGSMKQHSADLLRFAHAVVAAAPRVEVFTFGTRLTRVTEQLLEPDVDRALDSLADIVLDADARTRIGTALDELLGNARRRSLVRGALVVVLSDGLERGDCEAMIRGTHRLGLLGHRLVWWSPLACSPGYRPATHGMRGVLPSLDDLSGVRDLASALEAVRLLPATIAGPRRGAARAWTAAAGAGGPT
jgi:uncharacterized protein